MIDVDRLISDDGLVEVEILETWATAITQIWGE
jgi:hypothetical protein